MNLSFRHAQTRTRFCGRSLYDIHPYIAVKRQQDLFSLFVCFFQYLNATSLLNSVFERKKDATKRVFTTTILKEANYKKEKELSNYPKKLKRSNNRKHKRKRGPALATFSRVIPKR